MAAVKVYGVDEVKMSLEANWQPVAPGRIFAVTAPLASDAQEAVDEPRTEWLRWKGQF